MFIINRELPELCFRITLTLFCNEKFAGCDVNMLRPLSSNRDVRHHRLDLVLTS